jgi:AraC-like DNA-binding protein
MGQGEFHTMPFRQPGIVGVVAATRRRFARHTHDQYGLGIIESGAHRSLSGRGVVEAGAGEIITVNPNEVHDGAPIGDGPRRWRILYIDVPVVRDAWHRIEDRPSSTYEFTAPALRDGRSSGLLGELFRACADLSPEAAEAREQALLLLLARLRSEAKPDPVLRQIPVPVRDSIRRIDADPAAPVSLADLADACHLSRFQALRAFARATGFTPHAYLMQRRIDLVRGLLRRGTPLVEAALAGGFADQSHMTKVFVGKFGYTPGAYARAVR